MICVLLELNGCFAACLSFVTVLQSLELMCYTYSMFVLISWLFLGFGLVVIV
jgi:hypothetical protein